MEIISTNSLDVKVGVFCNWDTWSHVVEGTLVKGLGLLPYE